MPVSLPFEPVSALGKAGGGDWLDDQLVIRWGYTTDAWKHSTFGNEIIRATEWRDAGLPISIVSEKRWIECLEMLR